MRIASVVCYSFISTGSRTTVLYWRHTKANKWRRERIKARQKILKTEQAGPDQTSDRVTFWAFVVLVGPVCTKRHRTCDEIGPYAKENVWISALRPFYNVWAHVIISIEARDFRRIGWVSRSRAAISSLEPKQLRFSPA